MYVYTYYICIDVEKLCILWMYYNYIVLNIMERKINWIIKFFFFLFFNCCSSTIVSIFTPLWPPTLEPTPFGFIHMSFIHVPWWPFLYYLLLSLYKWNLINKTNKQAKYNQRHWYKEQTDSDQRGEGREMNNKILRYGSHMYIKNS